MTSVTIGNETKMVAAVKYALYRLFAFDLRVHLVGHRHPERLHARNLLFDQHLLAALGAQQPAVGRADAQTDGQQGAERPGPVHDRGERGPRGQQHPGQAREEARGGPRLRRRRVGLFGHGRRVAERRSGRAAVPPGIVCSPATAGPRRLGSPRTLAAYTRRPAEMFTGPAPLARFPVLTARARLHYGRRRRSAHVPSVSVGASFHRQVLPAEPT